MIRLSGPAAVQVATALLQAPALEPRHATFARLIDPSDRSVVDQVVATWFAAPHSYTGEDVIEISAHGSPLLLTRIVQLAMAQGARLAEPGEFTLRAYLRGRLDLAQAEAVADLVDAVTPLQARAAMDQLEGTLTGAIARVDAALFDLSAKLEASLDYPDEGFHFISTPEAIAGLGAIRDQLDQLARDGRAGRVIREGRTVVLVGRPNAGKSSLFNALAGASRAIVTDVPGTTRDLLVERVEIDGIAITLVDTAGLREARDAIEAEGVRRARDAQHVAALNLIVVDGSAPLSDEDAAIVATIPAPRLVVVSKTDLPRAWTGAVTGAITGAAETDDRARENAIDVSAVTGAGLERLRARMVAALTAREDLRDPPAITNARHLALVEIARGEVARASAALADGATEELVLADLGRARGALEEITGRRTTDDLLAHIFARFCLGK